MPSIPNINFNPSASNVMFTKEFQIIGIENLQVKLNLLKNIAETKKLTALTQAGHLMVGFCKVNCPVDTGRLRASIGNPSKDGVFNKWPDAVVFGTSVYYAPYVEDGTPPHDIVPVNAKVLAWPAKAVAAKVKITETGISRKGLLFRSKTGKLTSNRKETNYFFAKRVRHPGYRGSHFMLNGVTQSIPAVIDFLDKFYTEAMMI